MPTTIINLSDEIIRHIAHFVHTDNEIPIPSFNPRWANFADEIDPTIQKDYIAFRSTCSYIRKLCPLGGLHVRMDSWAKLLKWAVQAPVDVKRAIRRMIIDIPRIELDKDKQLANYSIVPIWFTLTSFLRSLSNLEEVILRSTPLCQHPGTGGFITPLALNGEMDFLPNVRSIAIETHCRLCADQLPQLIFPLAPHLQYVKLSPSFDTQRLIGTGLSASSGFEGIDSVKTLFWKTTRTIHKNQLLREISKIFPTIRTIHLSCFSSVQHHPGAAFTLFCYKAPEPWVWYLKMTCEKPPPYDVASAGPVEDWEDDQTFERFLTILSEFEHLEELDCLIDIKTPPRKHDHSTISRGLKKSTYDNCQDSMNRSADIIKKMPYYEEYSYSAMKAAGHIIAASVPTLRVGYFWQYITHHHLLDKPYWRRWRWVVQRSRDKVRIELDGVPEEFNDSWMSNDDGCRDWDWIAEDDEDDESDDD